MPLCTGRKLEAVQLESILPRLPSLFLFLSAPRCPHFLPPVALPHHTYSISNLKCRCSWPQGHDSLPRLSAVLILAGFPGTETVGKAKPSGIPSCLLSSTTQPSPEGGLQSGWPQYVRNSLKSQASTMLTTSPRPWGPGDRGRALDWRGVGLGAPWPSRQCSSAFFLAGLDSGLSSFLIIQDE